jgi:hypothetical protein
VWFLNVSTRINFDSTENLKVSVEYENSLELLDIENAFISWNMRFSTSALNLDEL